MEYIEYYDGYQPDYQEASMDHNDWISEEEHYMGNQGNYQFQPYNNNLSYWNQDVEYPQDQGYTPFQNQQGQGYFQTRPFIQLDQGNYHGDNFGNQGCYQEEMSNQNRGFANFNNQGQHFQDDDIMSMLKQLLEGQSNEKKEISEMKACCRGLYSKFEGLATYVNELENQLAQVASTSINNEEGVLPEKPEPNPNENCQAIILRNGTELPSRGEAEKMDESKVETKMPEEKKVSVEKEADSKVLEEEVSLQKVLTVKQDELGLLDATCVGIEKLLDSHKIHDGETSFLELKEELNVMELKEASNGKTSMESKGKAEKQDEGKASSLELKKEPYPVETERGSKRQASNGKTSMERDLSEPNSPRLELKPLPQELKYQFSDLNFTYHVIENDALSETEIKTFLVKPISDGRWIPPVHVEPKKGKVIVVNNDCDELIPTRTIISHRICIDYRKFDASTRRYHFPWPFTDQMLSIFSYLNENVVKVLIDDFSVFGDVLVSCMSNLCRTLKRCAETNIVLNWKKCQFMERKCTILGDTIPEKCIVVDKAEVARPLTQLLYEGKSLELNKVSLETFTKITRELVNESIVHVPDWSFPFESGGDSTVTLSEPLTS